MGKRQVHILVVRKAATLGLLVLTSGAMVALLWFLSGKAYAAELDPLRAVLTRSSSLTRDRALALVMPLLANILLFVPWGFLTFLALDKPARSRAKTYALTFAAGVVFAACMHAMQEFLPTRVVTLTDSLANSVGALLGAMLGQMRKDVRVRFEV